MLRMLLPKTKTNASKQLEKVIHAFVTSTCTALKGSAMNGTQQGTAAGV